MMPFQKNIKYIIRWFSLGCLLIWATPNLHAQEDAVYEEDTTEMYQEEVETIQNYDGENNQKEVYILDDTSTVTYQKNEQDLLEKYRGKEDFVYTYNYGKATSFWDRLAKWFQKIFGLDWQPKQTQTVGEFFKWVIILTAVACLIFILFKNEIQGIFLNAKKLDQTLKADLLETNFKSSEIDGFIEKAKAENNFDDLVRWYFVKTIQLMNEKQLIKFHQNKTNNDYVYELKNKELKAPFKELNYYFDHIVYGGFHITKNQMEKAEIIYQKIKTEIQ